VGAGRTRNLTRAASPSAEAAVRANVADQAIGYIRSDVNEVFTIFVRTLNFYYKIMIIYLILKNWLINCITIWRFASANGYGNVSDTMSYILLCSSTLRAIGDHGSAATHEVSVELGAVRSLYTDDACTDDVPDPRIARDTLNVILQEARREPDFQRPAWLSSEIMAWAVGAHTPRSILQRCCRA
jgi:hypothetical protein